MIDDLVNVEMFVECGLSVQHRGPTLWTRGSVDL